MVPGFSAVGLGDTAKRPSVPLWDRLQVELGDDRSSFGSAFAPSQERPAAPPTDYLSLPTSYRHISHLHHGLTARSLRGSFPRHVNRQAYRCPANDFPRPHSGGLLAEQNRRPASS